jgi:hypothetical protein
VTDVQLENLAGCTPARANSAGDALDDALNGINVLAQVMNEEKRDERSRLRLIHWQQRITFRGQSSLVQPFRRLESDGELNLIRLVKKASSFVEVDNTNLSDHDGDQTIMPSKIVVPVEYLAPEPMERAVMVILCSDMIVLVQQREGGGGWEGAVDLFNVLRPSTMVEPASIVHGNVLRVVDNKVSGRGVNEAVKLIHPSQFTTLMAALTPRRHCNGAEPSMMSTGNRR